MNVFDNEVVLQFDAGSIRYRDVPNAIERCFIRYTGTNPNGALNAPTGSVAFGPSGSWENISPGSGGSTWELIGTKAAVLDGFLAPNEFYVDPSFPLPGPTGREVHTIAAAITLANVLFATGISIVIRLREGQLHVWAHSTVGPQRDITLWAQGQVTGDGVNDVVAGRVVLGGAGVSLSNAGVRRVLEIKNLAVQGSLTVGPGWDFVGSEVTYAGSTLTVNQGGGAGLDTGITLNRCDDDGDSTVDSTKAFQILTVNHGPPGTNPTRFLIAGCQFNPVVTAVEPTAFLAAGNSSVVIRQTSITGRLDQAIPGLFAATTPGTSFQIVDTTFVLDSPSGDGTMFDTTQAPPTVYFLGNCRVNVMDASSNPLNWNVGKGAITGPLLVELGQPPSNPFPGLVMSDENLQTSVSGSTGPITKRVMTKKGVAFTGGRKIYGKASPTDFVPSVVTWYTPTITPAHTPSAPTTQSLPIGSNQVVSVQIRLVSSSQGPAGSETLDFQIVVQKIAGVATIVFGGGAHTDFPLIVTPTIDGNNELILTTSLIGGPTSADVTIEATFIAV